jgi:predicted transcriptional regulator
MSERLTSLQRRALAALVEQIDAPNTSAISANYIALRIGGNPADVLTALRALARRGYVDEKHPGDLPPGFAPTRKGREVTR